MLSCMSSTTNAVVNPAPNQRIVIVMFDGFGLEYLSNEQQTKYSNNRPVVPMKWSVVRDRVFAFEYPSAGSWHLDVQVERETK